MIVFYIGMGLVLLFIIGSSIIALFLVHQDLNDNSFKECVHKHEVYVLRKTIDKQRQECQEYNNEFEIIQKQNPKLNDIQIDSLVNYDKVNNNIYNNKNKNNEIDNGFK